MSAIKKSELVRDQQHQTDFATVNGNPHVVATIGTDAVERAESHGTNWKALGTGVALAAVTVCLLPTSAHAVAETVSISEIIDVSSIVTSVVLIGGAGLAAAFGVGGGFRIAQKIYGWIIRKM